MDGHIDGIQKASCGPFTRAKPSEKPRSHTVQLSGGNGRVGSALFSCKHQGGSCQWYHMSPFNVFLPIPVLSPFVIYCEGNSPSPEQTCPFLILWQPSSGHVLPLSSLTFPALCFFPALLILRVKKAPESGRDTGERVRHKILSAYEGLLQRQGFCLFLSHTLWLSLMLHLMSFVQSWLRAFGKLWPLCRVVAAHQKCAEWWSLSQGSSGKMLCTGGSHSAPYWLPAFRQQRAAPRADGHVSSPHWWDVTWQAATGACIEFVTGSVPHC